VASSWILFFSYQDDERSNTNQRKTICLLHTAQSHFLIDSIKCKYLEHQPIKSLSKMTHWRRLRIGPSNISGHKHRANFSTRQKMSAERKFVHSQQPTNTDNLWVHSSKGNDKKHVNSVTKTITVTRKSVITLVTLTTVVPR